MLLYKELNLLYDFGYKSDDEISIIDVYNQLDELPEDLIERHISEISLRIVCLHQRLSDEFLSRNSSSIPWDVISYNYVLSEDFIERHYDYLDFYHLSCKGYISDKFIEKHLDWFNLQLCSRHCSFSEDFIDRHKDELNWFDVCKNQHLSEEFIESHLEYVNWINISSYQLLSESFLKRHEEEIYHSAIEVFGNFSEEFIYENLRNGNFDEYIFQYCNLSESFLERLINDRHCFRSYYFDNISRYQRLSTRFKLKYSRFLTIDCKFDNWLYESTENKKQAVIDTGLYECYDDYFIAYKAIRYDRYSLYNFKYKYKKGGVYESWCDCTSEKNSFGLNVGTSTYATIYSCGNGMLVRCKVRYEDVGRVVHGGNKIRCFKIEVLD